MPYEANKNELEVLQFWQEDQTFEKSVQERPENRPYVFYDGPPFATGLPHYGHILSSVIKDLVPRYWTMKGYRVRRRWCWDCHGLPIENLIEKELNISGKKEIEEKLGVDKFNEACRSKVLLYTQEWKKMVSRIGRWIEFDNSYKTMDATYMESVWWALRSIWDKGLIYEGKKVLMYCPRCETPISKAEVAMDDSYKDISEETVTVKFKVKSKKLKDNSDLPDNTYILAWTTTPWTLPCNVALAVGRDIVYVLVKVGEENYLLAQELLPKIMEMNYQIQETFKGKDLVDLEYEPLFEIPAIRQTGKGAWYVASADFVTTLEGTGVVHTAVVYGEDDYNLGVKIGLPVVPLLDYKGIFNEEAPEFIRWVYFKDAEEAIKNDLARRGLIFARAWHTHSYPNCWRCDTQLFYNAISAWFINIQKIKSRLIKLNEKINWYPEHLKEGRFLNILETAPDWNISRNRYWATPLPFWKCECGETVCVGSVQELKKKATNFSEVYASDKIEEMDLHKHIMDKIKLRCDKCEGEMSRIPEVIDCWVESASMPFAEFHYPFENKKVFEARFPGEYIGEYIGQVRAWFYYMHVLAVLLFEDVSFKNCVVTGNILNEKGEKLSKSKRNFTDPWAIIERYGMDALRYYLTTSVVMQAEDLFFVDDKVREIYNKVINILWNVVEFYKMYTTDLKITTNTASDNVLDKWILAKLNLLVKEMTEAMDKYDTVKAGRPLQDFIDELSTWYVRRSSDSFKGEDKEDKEQALATLHLVLSTLSKLMAPFMPFLAEKIYYTVTGDKQSVHLQEWPQTDDKMIDNKMISEMAQARKVVEMGLALRAEVGIKVRQPLAKLQIANCRMQNELLNIIADELNVKDMEIRDKEINDNLKMKEEGDLKVGLDITITAELKKAGLVREIVRTINQMRKEQRLTIKDKIIVEYQTEDKILQAVFVDDAEEIKKSVLAEQVKVGEGAEVEVDGVSLKLKIEKI